MCAKQTYIVLKPRPSLESLLVSRSWSTAPASCSPAEMTLRNNISSSTQVLKLSSDLGRRLFFFFPLSPFCFKARAGWGYMTTWNQCRFLMMHEMKYCCPEHSEYSEFCSVIDTSCAALTGQKRPPQQLQLCPAPQPGFGVGWVAIFCWYTLFFSLIHLAAS